MIHKPGTAGLFVLAALIAAAAAAPFLCAGMTDSGFAFQGVALPVYLLSVTLGYCVMPIVVFRLTVPYLSANDINGGARLTIDCAILCGIGAALLGIVIALLSPALAAITGIPEGESALRNACLPMFVIPLSGVFRGWLWSAGAYAAVGLSVVLPRVLFPVVALIAFGGPESAVLGSWWTAMLIAHGVVLLLLIGLFVAQTKRFYQKSDVNPLPAIARHMAGSAAGLLLAFCAPLLLSLAEALTAPSRFQPQLYSQLERLEGFSLLGGVLLPCALFVCAMALLPLLSVLPSTIASLRKGEKRQTVSQMVLAQKLCLVFSMPAAAVFAVLARPICQLFFGVKSAGLWEASSLCGALLCPAVALFPLGMACAALLCALGRNRPAALNAGVFFVLKLALNYILASPPRVLSGAAAATSIAVFVYAALNFMQLAKTVKFMPSPLNAVLKPLFSAVCMGAAMYFLYYGILEPALGPIGLVLAALAGLTIYLALIVSLKAFTPADYAKMPLGSSIQRMLEHAGMSK